jgi:flavin-dependent dehydrogenase
MDKDILSRLTSLSSEKRLLLQKMLKEKNVFTETEQVQLNENLDATYDVVIIGGGLASLTLTLQILQTHPDIRILIVEKKCHPVPEAAHKVGESTVEVGAHYFGEILGLRDHIKTKQLPKFGLRYFFKARDNSRISNRFEIGATFFPPAPSYQLDRGRFENMLGIEAQKLGATFWDGCKVKAVDLGHGQHRVSVLRDNKELQIGTRWVIDGSGRTAFLKRQLGLERDVNHQANAAWFRINDKIDVEEWSDDPQWLSYTPAGKRRLSTNHLMGDGYWVWIIPVASGGTSIGIVTDANMHAAHTTNRLEKALAWLNKYESQCGQVIEERKHLIQDFHALRHFAYGCKRVYSSDRWCLIGEASAFVDPFYSPGSDFIALGNTFVTDLIVRDFSGEDIQQRVEHHNQTYLNTFDTFLPAYDGQYPMMGNAQVMTTKIVWDFAIYWAFIGMVFFHNKYCDLDFMASVSSEAEQFARLSSRMQQFFNEWGKIEHDIWPAAFVDILNIEFLYQLNKDLVTPFSDDELRAKIADNLILCENIAVEMFSKAAQLLSEDLENKSINPYAITLHPERWGTEGLFDSSIQRNVPVGIVSDLKKIWIDHIIPQSTPSIM